MRIFICALFFSFLIACSKEPATTKESEEFKIESLTHVQGVRPEKPVKIKLKRDNQGRYSWELSGDNPEEIIRVDRRLKKAFVPEQSGQ